MNTKRTLSRFAVCLLVVFVGITSVAVLLSVAAPTSAMPLPNNTPPQTISGTVTLWHAYGSGSADETALMQVVTNALAANPGLTITVVQIPFDQIYSLYETEVISGGGPDMFVAPNDNLGNQVRAGVIRNLDAYLQGRLTNVYTTAIDGMKVNGQLHAVPESAKVVALYYNKTTISTPPTLTADLLTLVQGGKKFVIGSGVGAYYNFGFFGAFGGQLLDSTGRCIADRGGFAPAMQYLVDLKNAGAIVITDYGAEGRDAFQAGAIDMIIDGPWNLADYQLSLGTNLGVALMPAGPVDVARPMNGVDGFYINPNTTNFTSTVELALFMTNQASSQIFTDIGEHIPVRTDVTSTNPLVTTFAQASVPGYPRPQGPELSNYWGPFGDMMTSVLSETVSPTTGVMIACDTMNQLNGFPVYKLYLPLVIR